MLWKNRLILGLIWVVLELLAVGVTSLIRPVYRAELLLLVDSQTIPEKFVSSTVSANLLDRVATTTQQVLSPERLWKMIESLDLYREERARQTEEEVLQKMRDDIAVAPEKGFSQSRQGAFRLSYEGTDPRAVAQVVNQVGQLLIEESLRAREALADGTSSFVRNELEQARKRLEEQDARLSAYKLSHNGSLPQQQDFLLRTLDSLKLQLQSVQDAISRQHQNKVALENTLEFSKTAEESIQRFRESVNGTSANGSQEKPAKLSVVLEQELNRLLTRYTEAYPKVQELRSKLNYVRRLEAVGEKVLTLPESERTAKLTAQLSGIDKEIAQKQEESRRLVQQIDSVQQTLQQIPIRERELAGLTRDYDTSKAQYTSLLDKIYAADMASNMEKLQKAERFSILSPAQVPGKPFKKRREVLLGIGSGLALALALGFVIGRELLQNRILGEWELPAGVIVLGRVPQIGVKKDTWLARYRHWFGSHHQKRSEAS
jgi:uncharacterized protein involved in exopolysaccharide biosynthesis